MSIWTYEDASKSVPQSTGEKCLYCRRPLKNLKRRTEGDVRFSLATIRGSEEFRVDVCKACGWWVVTRKVEDEERMGFGTKIYRADGCLKELDEPDISDPLQELQSHLIQNYRKRFELHPRKYEELVGSVFRGLGYEVRVTSYSGDEGIDLFVLDGTSNDLVGVQVKRYRGKIEAEQIRAFVGAMVLRGLTRGIFVTTSKFRTGAKNAAEKSAQLGWPVELWDAGDFYDKLELTRRRRYRFLDEPDAPFLKLLEHPMELQLVFEDFVIYE